MAKKIKLLDPNYQVPLKLYVKMTICLSSLHHMLTVFLEDFPPQGTPLNYLTLKCPRGKSVDEEIRGVLDVWSLCILSPDR